MNLIGLNASFQVVKTLTCINIQWNRKYYEPGEYALQMRACDWDTGIAYVYTPDRPETGMVEKVETEHTVKGDLVNVSGFFLEGMLNWKVTYPKHSSAGNLSAACKALVGALLTDTGVTVPTAADVGAAAMFESEGEFLGDATYAALKAQELGQKIRYDYDSGLLLYSIWQGADRSQSQGVNPYAVFSQDFGTVDSMTLTRDTSAYRNYAIVLYDGGSFDIDLRTGGGPKRILYVDTGMTIEDGQTQADFLAAVTSEARKQLAEYPSVLNIDADVMQNNILYGIDYDLGDKCDVRDDRLQLAFETRIIEVREVWKNNTHGITLQFGDKIPTAYQRGRA
ncbi:MAG: hypothetical protein VB104_07535 [Candidatus Limiplasma sp.]|nr:hypothetical protein [Candidatus Limiplasma sp.]